MSLNNRQKKFLRGQAHSLNPVVDIGQKGVSEAVLKEIEKTLDHHELIKIRISCDDQAELKAILDNIVSGCQANLVQVIGHTVILYREAEEPKIKLPS